MGVLNLLKEFGPALRPAHLSSFRGRTIGVDASCWLHRSAFCCALELVRSEDDATLPHPAKYLFWLRKMVRMLLGFDITPLFVFDGSALPAKAGTNSSRDRVRTEWKARGDALFEQGRSDEAYDAYGKCIRVTTTMLRNFQHLLRSEGVKFIVAPYEADAQIAYLYQQGHIYAAITEDSDLLPFGCRRLLLKLDRDANCKHIDLDAFEADEWDPKQFPSLAKLKRIMQSTDAPAAARVTPPPSSHINFLHACVLSGCDYLPSLHGIGLKKAINWVHDFPRIDNLLHHLQKNRKKMEDRWAKERETKRTQEDDEDAAADDSSSKMTTSDYIAHFYRAVATFQHQLVFDPKSKALTHLSPLPPQLQSRWERSMQQKKTSEADACVVDDDVLAVEDSVASSPDSSAATLPSSHPLLRVTDFSFLGPPMPSHLVPAFVSGELDPKTLEPHKGTWRRTDINAIEAAQARNRTSNNQTSANHHGRRGHANAPAAPSVTPNFFGRSASTPVRYTASAPRPFSLSSSAASRAPTLRVDAVASSRQRQQDSDLLDDFFSDDELRMIDEMSGLDGTPAAAPAATPATRATSDFIATRPSEEVNRRTHADSLSSGIGDELTPPTSPRRSSSSSVAPTLVAVASSSSTASLNPFAVREHKLLDADVTTFADLAPVDALAGRAFTNVTRGLVSTPAKTNTAGKTTAATSFLTRIFGPTGAAATSTNSHTSPVTHRTQSSTTLSPSAPSSATDTPQSGLCRPSSVDTTRTTARAVVAHLPTAADDEADVCDLTGDTEEPANVSSLRFTSPSPSSTPASSSSSSSSFSAPLSQKRRSSSSSSSSVARKSSPKRKKGGAAVDNARPPATSLLAFFSSKAT